MVTISGDTPVSARRRSYGRDLLPHGAAGVGRILAFADARDDRGQFLLAVDQLDVFRIRSMSLSRKCGLFASRGESSKSKAIEVRYEEMTLADA